MVILLVSTMIQGSLTFLAIKLITVPILIWTISTAAGRWGPSIGGLLLGLPMTSGPILIFLAFEQGNIFVSEAALGTLMGLVSFSASAVAYGRLAHKTGWPASLVGCCITYFLITLIWNVLFIPLAPSFICVIGFLVVSRKLMPVGRSKISSEIFIRKLSAWEIPARMLAATALVLVITESASVLGPRMSGLMTPFPVYSTVIAVFLHKFDGTDACSIFLRGVLTGCFTAAVFLFFIASLIVQLGLFLTMSLAILLVIVMHSFLLYLFAAR